MESNEVSPTRGIKGILAKPKSSGETSTAPASENSPRRDSGESIITKIKSRIGSVDDDKAGEGKMSKLIPGHSKRKEKRRQLADSTEDLRGRSTRKNPQSNLSASESLSTLDDEQSSLMTSESEEELPASATRAPTLESRPSHSGYLTSSSPQIKATAVSEGIAMDQLNSPSPKTMMPLTKATTLPAPRTPTFKASNKKNSGSTANMGLNGASTLTIDSRGSSNSANSRSVSPGSSFRDVFRSGSRNNSAKIDEFPDQPATSPVTGSFLVKEKSGSLASRRASKTSETKPTRPAIQTSNGKAGHESLPSIVTNPGTPPPGGSSTAPATAVIPPTPVDREDTSRLIDGFDQAKLPGQGARGSTTANSSHLNAVSHRRVRSDAGGHPPSKLSHAITAPLTPTIEEARTPGSRSASGNTITSNNFFSSMFSAAQNAANTLSTSLANNPPRPRATTTQSLPVDDEKGLSASNSEEKGSLATSSVASKPLAIETIGSGDLSLSHLGLASNGQSTKGGSVSPISTNGDANAARSRSGTVVRKEEAAAREEGISAARAVSAAYSRDEGSSASTPIAEDVGLNVKPASVYEQETAGARTPPNGSIADGDGSGLWRSGSLRSKVDRAKRRHRNNSVTDTIGATTNTSTSALVTPGNGTVPKVTGFAVASKKRNRDFHQLFRTVPEDDYLIEDYSCALQRDIILAGRIYISEGHICFSSNILGWVTTLVISFDEVVSVEKENTAMVFPNAIAIQTLHARHTLRSLLSREATYDLIIGIWKISHPSLQSSENGVRLLNGGTGSKTEKVDPVDSDDGSDGSDENGEVYDEDDDDEDGDDGEASGSGLGTGSIAESEVAESPPKAAVARKPSALGIAAGQAAGAPPTVSDVKAAEKLNGVVSASVDFPGPAQHAPTECADGSTHYDKILKDEVILAPLGKIYSVVFGAASGGFMSRWLIDEIKVTELQMEGNKKGLTEENRTRSYSYIKPLNSAIGPKSTKCVITEQLDAFDLEKAVSVTVTTQTPDVPSGNVFSTKTRYCMMWGPGNGTRVILTSTIEWTGKSWIKGAIEKGASDGQTAYANDLLKALRLGLSTRARASTTSSRLKKGRKRKGEAGSLKSPSLAVSSPDSRSHWGLFEPVHGILGPVVDSCAPLFNAHGLIGLLSFLLIISWFGNSRSRYIGLGDPNNARLGLSAPERIAAYEELWKAEEAALWHWLEARIGLPGDIILPVESAYGRGDRDLKADAIRQDVLKGNTRRGHGKVKSMNEREVEWAIGVTEEKLKVLKDVVARSKHDKTAASSNKERDEDHDSDQHQQKSEGVVPESSEREF